MKKQFLELLLMVGFIFAGCVFIPFISAEVIYVDAGASGPVFDGSSWQKAYTDLQTAIDEAQSNDQVWVAAGIYYPAAEKGGTGSRFKAFQMKNNVEIYGGFDPSNGITDISERDYKNAETILSGDTGTSLDVSDNCYHVFYHPSGLGLDSSAVLDGFTVEMGYSAQTGSHVTDGAGMYNDGCSPLIRNCKFINNTARQYGGAICCFNGSEPVIEDCSFIYNRASSGGAVSNFNQCGSEIKGCFFENNFAGDKGGAVFNYQQSSPVIDRCVFVSNMATEAYADGGAVYNGYDGSTVVSDSLFYYNRAFFGAGVYCLGSGISITNCTFFGNYSDTGASLYNQNSESVVSNSIVWQNSVPMYNTGAGSISVLYCDVQGAWPGVGNIDNEPGFVNSPDFVDVTVSAGTESTIVVEDGSGYFIDDIIEIQNDGQARTVTSVAGGTVTFSPALSEACGEDVLLANWGQVMGDIDLDEDFQLSEGSPAVEAGNNMMVSIFMTGDLKGRLRKADGNCDVVSTVDMGAYEFSYLSKGDFDYNCSVDLIDFHLLASWWQSSHDEYDIVLPDGIVGVSELEVIATYWLTSWNQ